VPHEIHETTVERVMVEHDVERLKEMHKKIERDATK